MREEIRETLTALDVRIGEHRKREHEGNMVSVFDCEVCKALRQEREQLQRELAPKPEG
jgi:hypothetical protein